MKDNILKTLLIILFIIYITIVFVLVYLIFATICNDIYWICNTTNEIPIMLFTFLLAIGIYIYIYLLDILKSGDKK